MPEKNQERAKELINKLKLDAVEEFKKNIFKGREKKYHLTNETMENIEKFISNKKYINKMKTENKQDEYSEYLLSGLITIATFIIAIVIIAGIVTLIKI